MSQSLRLFFVNPQAFLTFSDESWMDHVLVVTANISSISQRGKNLLVFDGDNDLITGIESVRYKQNEWRVSDKMHNKSAAPLSDQLSAAEFINACDIKGIPEDLFKAMDLEDFFLFIVSFSAVSADDYFICISRNSRCSYYIKFYEEADRTIAEAELFNRIMRKFEVTRKNINHGKWYSKWKYEYEMEVKYTSFEWVDVWRLLLDFYHKIRTGCLQGFIPEINDEFQVWDYDNRIFEVTHPAEKRGYVSFIQQADGKVSVKYKQFEKDQELRKEMILPNQPLEAKDFAEFAVQLSKGEIASLPSFRRKRFDVNIESINTGNVYGVFMEVCRVAGDTAMMIQVEVEYLRSRVLHEFENVEEEYIQLCEYTRAYLMNYDEQLFKKGYYSKLSFVKDTELSNQLV